ncbi:uncharacterized protein I206_102271 [Kwoniella pini CBS 10737]|uniref:Uncharacterized protein n=1 Tax=Kwoniella pini CBS 10737 TaxID=1296096 RepID=A0A1B9HT12_9TREE|nr:uncharacterized protein I206_07641 [Kwoniella pini CBS 10737]OCF46407.1 hypothetical protein I206_07641 [Kwoniella pini CBS 10737]
MYALHQYDADEEDEEEGEEEEHECENQFTCPHHCSKEDCKEYVEEEDWHEKYTTMCFVCGQLEDYRIDRDNKRDAYWVAHEKYDETPTPTDLQEVKEETEAGQALTAAYNELIDAKIELKNAKRLEGYTDDELADSYGSEDDEYNCPDGI